MGLQSYWQAKGVSPLLDCCDHKLWGERSLFQTLSQLCVHKPTAHPLLTDCGIKAEFIRKKKKRECRDSWVCSPQHIQRGGHEWTVKPTCQWSTTAGRDSECACRSNWNNVYACRYITNVVLARCAFVLWSFKSFAHSWHWEQQNFPVYDCYVCKVTKSNKVRVWWLSVDSKTVQMQCLNIKLYNFILYTATFVNVFAEEKQY